MEFDWDPKKSGRNLKDHTISFEEAKTVFGDPLSITYPDPDHSFDEYRFIIRLDPDVARAFPTEEAVNEALRLLMKIARTQLVQASLADNQ